MPGCDILADNKEENPLLTWEFGFLLRKKRRNCYEEEIDQLINGTYTDGFTGWMRARKYI